MTDFVANKLRVIRGEQSRATTASFALTTMQRRAASSTRAIRRTLQRRVPGSTRRSKTPPRTCATAGTSRRPWPTTLTTWTT